MDNIKRHLRLFLKMMLRVSLRVTFFVPVKKNKILFFAGMRGYVCNPKYICEYLNEKYPRRFELCWIGKNAEEVKDYPYITFIKYSPFTLFYALASSRVFVTNGENAICPKSRKRLIICTWHGAAFKRVGFDINDDFVKTDMKHSAIDIFLSLSKEYTDHCIRSGFAYRGKIIKSGYPRNDIFFDIEKMKKTEEKVRAYFGITGKFILFAPTFRGVYQTADKLDFRLDFARLEKSLRKRFGDDYTVGVRMHYFDKNQYDFPKHIIDVGAWPDMQEVMCATDILITDYSSTIWDFSLTGRPCILYVPDLEDYKQTRGIYIDPEEWPGVLCKNMDDLSAALEELDEEKCRNKANKYLYDMGSYENGRATEMTCKIITKACGLK